MGNNIMKKQINFSNFKLPKLNQTSPPMLRSSEQVQSNILKFYLSQSLKQNQKANHFPLYSFGSKKKHNITEYGVYEIPSAISVLTYNIWFGENNRQIRFQCILKILQKSQADFICLQEVTQQFINLLHSINQTSWIKDYYTAFMPMGWYDTVILSKYKCKFYKIPFQNSFMGRSMLFAQLIQQKGRNVIVGCMHYESLDGNSKLRQQQIENVQLITKNCERVVIVGDYNFSDGYQQNKKVGKQYVDLWLMVHKPQQTAFTMPQTTKFQSWRPDHMLCKLPQSVNMNKTQIYRFGDFTIPPFENDEYTKIGIDDIVRTPSDHFGLIAYIPLK